MIECFEMFEKAAIACYDVSAAGIRGYLMQERIEQLEADLGRLRDERDLAAAHADARKRSSEGLLISTRDWLEIADRHNTDMPQQIKGQAAALDSAAAETERLRKRLRETQKQLRSATSRLTSPAERERADPSAAVGR